MRKRRGEAARREVQGDGHLATGDLDRALRERRGRLAAEQADLRGRVQSPDRWREDADVDVAVGGCSDAVLDVMKAIEDATDRVVDVIDLDRHPFPGPVTRPGIKVY